MPEELAIITYIRFGLDRGRPSLCVGIHELHYSSAVTFTGEEILSFVKESGASDIQDLVDRACVVESSGGAGGTSRYIRMHK